MNTGSDSQEMKRIAAAGIGAGCITALAAGWYLLSPFSAVAGCRNAIVELNAERASECIDFPVLRENLKSELPALMAKQMQQDPEMRDNPFSSLGMALIVPMISAMIDAYVTPAGLRTAFEMAKSSQAGGAASAENEGEVAAANRSAQLSDSLQKSSLGYKGLDKFQVTGTSNDGSKVTLIFDRQGFAGWKLASITF
jgi:hypothetical protein